MVYEIINPSDAYTMKHDDPAAAAVAGLFLGNGAYGLEDADGNRALPLFLLGGDPEAWLQETHGVTIEQVMAERPLAVAEALESVLIGGFDARREVESATEKMTPEDAAKWLAERHDARRTSMNNIGRRARSIAASLRQKHLTLAE